MSTTFDIISYNVHKLKVFFTRQESMSFLSQKDIFKSTQLILCQEIQWKHEVDINQHPLQKMWDKKIIFEANSLYPTGEHGNATFSMFPTQKSKNFDLTLNFLEHRGLLYTPIIIEKKTIHLFNTHLNLQSHERKIQAQKILNTIDSLHLNPTEPIIIGGDFNDWLAELSLIFAQRGFNDSSQWSLPEKNKRHFYATFPAVFPLYNIDRFYYKNIQLVSFEVIKDIRFRFLSDHLPIRAVFQF